MPDRSVLPFTVRAYEVDAAGQVLPATYLRWFQEAAIFASSESGFDEARYRQLGSTWFVRELHLELLAPLGAGETVQVFTWAAQMRTATAYRQYSARRPGGELLAQGEAEWAYIDRVTGRLRRIDRDPMKEFPAREEYVFADRDWGKQSLAVEPPGRSVHRREHTVLWSELDAALHVNNAVYARWATDHLAELRASEGQRGPGIIRRMRLRFLRGARGGERIEWLLWRDGGASVHRCASVETGDVIVQAVALHEDGTN